MYNATHSVPGGSSAPTHAKPGSVASLSFSVMSDEDIVRMSVQEMRRADDLGSSLLGPNGPAVCGTCRGKACQCLGHAGYIRVPTMLNPVYTNNVCRFLSLICLSCLRLRLSTFHIRNVLHPSVTLPRVIGLLRRSTLCCFCFRDGKAIRVKKSKGDLFLVYSKNYRVPLSSGLLLSIVGSLPEEDRRILGLPNPRDFIASVVYVPPLSERPGPPMVGRKRPRPGAMAGPKAAKRQRPSAGEEYHKAEADTLVAVEAADDVESNVVTDVVTFPSPITSHLSFILDVLQGIQPWRTTGLLSESEGRLGTGCWIQRRDTANTLPSYPLLSLSRFVIGRSAEAISVGYHATPISLLRNMGLCQRGSSRKGCLLYRVQTIYDTLAPHAWGNPADETWLSLFVHLISFPDTSVTPSWYVTKAMTDRLTPVMQTEIARLKPTIDVAINDHRSLSHTLHSSFPGGDNASKREALGRKVGFIRRHLMGRRIGNSARMPLSNSTLMPIDTVGIPPPVIAQLTQKHRICDFNRDRLHLAAKRGLVSTLTLPNGRERSFTSLLTLAYRFRSGDMVRRMESELGGNGNKPKWIVLHSAAHAREVLLSQLPLQMWRTGSSGSTPFPLLGSSVLPMPMLPNGTILYKRLEDGDRILINRQPSMYDTSLVCLRVKKIGGNAMLLNPVIQEGLRGDCDGDEINVYLAEDAASGSAEKALISPKSLLIDPNGKGTALVPIQDVLLFAFLLTLHHPPEAPYITTMYFNDSNSDPLSVEKRDRVLRIQKRLQAHSEKDDHLQALRMLCIPFEGTGAFAVSLLLPPTLTYTDGDVRITDGVFHGGALMGSHLGRGRSGLLYHLAIYHGPDAAIEFMDGLNRLTTEFSLTRATTFSLRDCLLPSNSDPLGDVAARCRTDMTRQIQAAPVDHSDSFFRTTALDIRQRVVRTALDIPETTARQVLDRSYISMIRSKSKGSTMHLSQILMPLGQQAFGEEGCIGNTGANRTSAYQRPTRYHTACLRVCTVSPLRPPPPLTFFSSQIWYVL
jgi:hypothetical protein